MQPNEKQINQFKTSISDILPVSQSCWDDIKLLITVKKLANGDYFSKIGQMNDSFGFLSEGILRMFNTNEKGKESIKHFFCEGDFIASNTNVEKKAIVYIQSLTESIILNLPINDFMKLSTKHKEIKHLVHLLMFRYFSQKQECELALISNNPVDKYNTFISFYPGIINKIAKVHIANYLGMSPTQLSRVQSKMEIN